MAFRHNDYEQLNIDDCTYSLSPKSAKALNNSWAKTFGDEIFPAIDEDLFRPLYSENDATRPNAPVNVIVGALIIKELFGYSDAEVVEGLALDIRLKYALHITGDDGSPFTDKTLRRFRRRCLDYEQETGVDLLKTEVKSLAKRATHLMGINGRIRRMDSMMIDACIKDLSRKELIYTCISNLVKAVNKKDHTAVPDDLKHYADPSDYNRKFYYHSEKEIDASELVADAVRVLSLFKEMSNTKEYQLLDRCISEQTVDDGNGNRRYATEEDHVLNSKVLQNPSDPDATYREKAGDGHKGYSANIQEAVGAAGSIIVDYDYQPNVYADSTFLTDTLSEMPPQDETVTIVADGAYTSKEARDLAESKNVELVTTSIAKNAKDIYADFVLAEDEQSVVQCPMGNVPLNNGKVNQDGAFNVTLARECCEHCPHKDECNAKIRTKTARVKISKTAVMRAISKRNATSERHICLSKIRNGVETVPSNLRKNYNLDKMPRGTLRGKFFLGCKVAAINFRKLLTYRRGLGRNAKNPLLLQTV